LKARAHAHRIPAALLAAALGLAGCAGTPSPTHNGASKTPFESAQELVPRLTLEEANDVTLYAISLVGTPYRYGGNTPEGGFDCSGLIGYVYKSRARLLAPRTVAALSGWGQPVAAHNLRSGDLVIFSPSGTANHAGIYVGEGRFVHAPSTGGEVRLEKLNSYYWAKQAASFRRP
jgi:cell wall-associated NlpC family hydrolase